MAPKRSSKRFLGELLIEGGTLKPSELEKALVLQKQTGRRLGSLLMQEGFIEEHVLLGALRQQLNIEVVASWDLKIEEDAWKMVSPDLIRKYAVIPLKVTGKELTLVMSDPFNLAACDEFKFATGCKQVKVILAAEFVIESVINQRLKSHGLIEDIIEKKDDYKKVMDGIEQGFVIDLPQDSSGEDGMPSQNIEVDAGSPPIINLVNYIFMEAYSKKASDIHIEPYQSIFRVRYRIDGVLQTILTPPLRLSLSIISRIKIMTGMDIAKRFIPQDGHLFLKIQSESVHFRVSSLPTVYGEKLVMRVIRSFKNLENVDALGFHPDVLRSYKRVISRPQGMVLFSGPTGSGKTTTLYASLSHINSADINIVTLEDPVESTMAGINHVQIRHGRGLGFADGLRSILRQDPDVIFVGEIRDVEVAEIAMQAAMTGHLVLSTLHANSTAEAFERLMDMGLEPYLISSTILAVVAQRLLRCVCESCREPYVVSKEDIEEFSLSTAFLEDGIFSKGSGCKDCMNTGYRGRVAAYEVLFMDGEIRRMVKQKAGAAEIRKYLHGHGSRSILTDGLEKVRLGITTFDEVRKVLMLRADAD